MSENTDPRPSRRQFLGLGAGAVAGLAGAAFAPGAAARPGNGRGSGGPPGGGRVATGIEVLLSEQRELLRGSSYGLITNPTGVLPDLGHEVDALSEADGLKPAAILAPEHGFRGGAQAGESGEEYEDPRTGVPVLDVYGKGPEEMARLFEDNDLDTLVFDIQDVGSRFYTYIWTMSDAMEAAAMSGRRFVVLDRPNPIGGEKVEGPVLEPRYSTFVGRYAISQRHGMTAGELAKMFNDVFVPKRTGGESVEDLVVVEMDGWRRGMLYEETGLPWVLPSPNMPTPETALVYPGTCLFEGTNLSEGRGTVRPFELIGAPYVEGDFSEALRDRDGYGADGVLFREAYFAPTFSKHEGVTVGGVQLHITDPEDLDPIGATLVMLDELKNLYPDDFEWRYDDYDPETPYWVDKLTGSDYVRKSLDAGESPEEVARGWRGELDEFKRLRERYLIYGGGRGPKPGPPNGPPPGKPKGPGR